MGLDLAGGRYGGRKAIPYGQKDILTMEKGKG